ncbi:hypothetical protein GDO78_013989 [Eleutherodactylus coqui]|uniref:Flavodoxin-like fold domain-containing protein n=1 Tax=Eleutherodactylus coqui TaxID=57060 RepID=A0A8J6EEZ3_ELECQ|nr:hypothetical protein GDO78_013989 [Eleutherodactylus coqui]
MAITALLHGKTALTVFAHQERTSFNYAMKEAAQAALQKKGWTVLVSDLYEMNFNAILSRDDIRGEPKHPNNFKYSSETLVAWKEGRLSRDIEEEQKKLDKADLVIFQFPLYWCGPPAIMKGWMERVFSKGFAYSREFRYSEGPFKSGILNFCGFQVLPPQIAYYVAHETQEVRVGMLKSWEKRLETIWDEKPIRFLPNQDFEGESGGYLLKKEVEEAKSADKYGPTVGQNLGKPLPPDSQLKSEGTGL